MEKEDAGGTRDKMNDFLPPEAKRVLILSPHPDDESIGCAGTIWLYSKSGAEVYLVVISDGEKLETAKDINNIVEIRRSETLRAANILGIKKVIFLGFPDERLGEYKGDIKKEITRIIREVNPDLVFVPFPLDPHSDHRTTAEILMSIRKDFRGFKIAFYEIYNAIRFNVLVDISSALDKKKEAIFSYKNSLLNIPEVFWHSIKGANAYRSLVVKKEGFFEAFWLIDSPLTDDDVIDWATFGKAESAAKIFISKLKQTDELLYKLQEINHLIRDREDEIFNLKQLIDDKEEEIKHLRDLSKEMETILHSVKKENLSLKSDLDLTKKNLDLILNSLSWKFVSKFYNIRDKILPEGSLRRHIYNKIVNKFKG